VKHRGCDQKEDHDHRLDQQPRLDIARDASVNQGLLELIAPVGRREETAKLRQLDQPEDGARGVEIGQPSQDGWELAWDVRFDC
jgi:hypothetical protein